ncbi:hypothetical protein H0A36_06225 [Endozoicomonas sp. SM1973]|uniref:WxxW domain-containing protein n=1 Tax=Spartinivicinus marinus TaxID=2994442 RepID=A0A853I2A3_9GAMM|nr:hypothetical protein [Spartinivicinus marinus]MCX4028267.1 hypothetical protein [Spartinivicinus marinus]NYZ65602.1 hypothetical protein [Spartinivicinus marinus]
MKVKLLLFLLLYAPLSCLSANFSAEIISQFHLITDPNNPKQLFYISRFGGIERIAPSATANVSNNNLINTNDVLPNFYAVTLYGLAPPFTDKEMVGFGGTFSTIENNALVKQLKKEAKQLGYTSIQPARHQFAQLNFIATAFDVINGQLALECKIEKIPVDHSSESHVTMPLCKIKGTDQVYDININLLYSLETQLHERGSTSTKIPFDAITLPGWKPHLQDLLNNGSPWNHLLTGVVDWTISDKPLNIIKLNVDWIKLYNFTFRELKSGMNPLLSREDVRTKMEELLKCNDIRQCGIQFADSLTPGKVEELGETLSLQDTLSTALFTEAHLTLRRRDPSATGRNRLSAANNTEEVKTNFIPKVNFYQVLQLQNGKLEMLAPNNNIKQYRTVLDINCIKGSIDGDINSTNNQSGCTRTADRYANYQWSRWQSKHRANFVGDLEMPVGCSKPIRVKARSKTGQPYLSLKERLLLSPRKGLFCWNKHQVDGKCADYEVSWLCEKGSSEPPIIIWPERPPVSFEL